MLLKREQRQEEWAAEVRMRSPDAEPPAASSALPSSVCPNCSHELQARHCKMSCPQCGFFLSCSDFY